MKRIAPQIKAMTTGGVERNAHAYHLHATRASGDIASIMAGGTDERRGVSADQPDVRHAARAPAVMKNAGIRCRIPRPMTAT